MRSLWSKIRGLFGNRERIYQELGEEIQNHLESEVEDNLARGMTLEQARKAAHRKLGNLALAHERAYESWSFPSLETIAQDLRYAARGMLHSPGFSAVLMLTIGLGVGLNSALFSVIDVVLLRPLPYPEAERLVRVEEASPEVSGFSVSWVNYQHWARENHAFDALAGFEFNHFTLTGRGEPSFTRAALVTSDYFGLTGMRPLVGRLFGADDDRPGAPPSLVLAYAFWRAALHGDLRIAGQTLDLNGTPYTILGVAAPEFQFFAKPVDFYIPLGPESAGTVSRAQHGSLRLLARLKPKVSLNAARADLDRIMQRLAIDDPGPESTHRAALEPLADYLTGPFRPTLWILMGAAGLVLLIVCANIANLLLARGSARLREISIRAALGAAAGRIVRQLLTENLLLIAAGGMLGLVLARLSLAVLISAAPPEIPRLAEASLNPGVLLFALALTLVTGLLAGAGPAIHLGRLRTGLNQGARAETGRRSHLFFRGALVSAEIALTLVLAFSSILLVRSLIAAQNRDTGFRPQGLLALELVLPEKTYPAMPSWRNFYDRLSNSLRLLPGVTDVGLVNCPPAAGVCRDWFYSVLEGPQPAQGEVPVCVFNVAGPDYFRTMQIPIREGRAFSRVDTPNGPPVAVVNQTFAAKWWPHESTVGKHIKLGGPFREGATYRIIGLAGDVGQAGLDAEVLPEVYLPDAQEIGSAMTVMIRAAGSPEALTASVRHSVLTLDSSLAIERLQTVDHALAGTLDRRRFTTMLLVVFAALAILLAAVGAYGVLSYWVTSREAEIAVRVAVGASRTDILRLIGTHAARLALWGAGAGLFGIWAASHWLRSLVFGVESGDSSQNAAAIEIAVLLVALATLIAALLPAWRGAQVDPATRLNRA